MASFFSERKSQSVQIEPGSHLDIPFPVANPGVIRVHSSVAWCRVPDFVDTTAHRRSFSSARHCLKAGLSGRCPIC